MKPILPLCLAIAIAIFTASCSDDPDGTTPDAGFTDVDTPDVDPVDDTGDDAFDEPDADDPSVLFCDPCTDDEECTEDGARCVELFAGERICGHPCEPGGDECPDDAFCASLGEDVFQCVPSTLTCVERCDDIACPAGHFCDPLTGECRRDARICDVGCNFDTECGDPDEFRCLGTGAPDGESICTSVCDPNLNDDQTLQCPSDFFCVALFEGADEGVCYPFTGTCTDRCVDADCPAGHNCDPFTGGCIEATYGACDAGCDNSAQCGGQTDLCLNVGIGDAAHCWLDCTDSQSCPDGYECQTFLEITTSLCLPLGLQCETCTDSDCFPGGICNPSTGECMPHPEDCVVEGCDEGELCEPASRRCVAVDRPCQGSSWAADCDNVITRCTTRRPDTDGICATLCLDDDDCHDGTTCTATQNGDFCLGPDLGGPSSCGTLTAPTGNVGRLCGTGAPTNCLTGTFCVEQAGVPGFCSQNCVDDSSCPAGSHCGLGPNGATVCLPDQCTCAGDLRLPPPLLDGLTTAFAEASLNACDLTLDDGLLGPADTGDLLLEDTALRHHLRYPLPGLGAIQQELADLDDAQTPPQALAAAITAAGFTPTDPPPPSPAPPFLDALQALATAAGGELPPDADAELTDVPDNVADLAAALVDAIADAYQARDQAFADAGLDPAHLDDLFDHAHALILPHSSETSVLDDPDLVATLEEFPIQDLLDISLALTAHITAAIDNSELTTDDLDAEFLAIFDTPAGLVILGDAGDTLYDPADNPRLEGPIALLLDIGGDDTYRLPVAANQSVLNGLSVLVDLGGDDLFTYAQTGDPLDGGDLLASDDAGRRTPDPAGPSTLGAVSLSDTARQGAGRLGIGLLFSLGEGDDTYETLRIGQGAAVLGVGALFDDGGHDTFTAEALAQGAALAGLGLLFNAAGDDSYHLWHAGQGFGTAGGTGILLDATGDDHYYATPGIGAPELVLYRAPFESGNVNANFAQGASVGTDQIAAGRGILRDRAGADRYDAAYFAQGYARQLGLGLLSDGDGADIFEARGSAQATAERGGLALFFGGGGDDEFNLETSPRPLGQGASPSMAFSAFIIDGGAPVLRYMTPGGAVSFDGGLSLALFDGGPSDHRSFGGGLGSASFDLPTDSPLTRIITGAFFVQLGAQLDLYDHPTASALGIDNDTSWRQDDPDLPFEIGVGLDQ